MKILINSLLRRILNSKTNLLINLLGLTIGMTAFLFITAWIISEKSYDRFWQEASQMYRVELKRSDQSNELVNTAKNYNGVGAVLQNELPEIEAATHLDKDIITVFTPDASVQDVNMFFTDSSFFKVFPRKIASENKNQLFDDIHNAIISRSLAQKLFGKAFPVNQSFKLNEGWEFNVVGVFDDVPANSHIRFDLILQRKALLYYMRNFDYATGELDNSQLSSWVDRDPYSQGQWKGTRGYTYIRLKPGAHIQDVEAKYTAAIEPCIQHIRQNNESVQFEFMPVSRIHLFSKKDGEMFANGSNVKVWAFALIGLLLIVTSLLNFINISVASSISQTTNRGVHRILGANRGHLLFEFFGEAFLFNLIAGLISFLLGAAFLKSAITIGGFEIFSLSWGMLILVCCLLVLVGTFVSSVYPFLYVVSKMLKSARSFRSQLNRGSLASVKALVVFQFGIAIFLIIGTMTVFRQLQFMQNTDTGIEMDHTMVSFSPMTMIKKPDQLSKLETFRSEVQKIPGVKGFTTAEIVAGEDYHRSSDQVWIHGQEENKKPFSIARVDYDYFDLFSIDLLAGSLFSPTSRKDANEVLINQSACKQLGIDPAKAVNSLLVVGDNTCRILGVIKDYHHLSLKDEIKPVIYYNSLWWYRTVGYYFVKISPQDMQATIASVTKLWNQLYPQEEYHFRFLDDCFNEAYQADNNFGRVYLALALLTIFIAAMGLFALAKFASKARVKEIGIRKVNGAKISEILALLNKDFVKWVIVAFVIATPIAYYAMSKWLENFAYKTNLSWWIFALAGLLALGIALLTVSWQSWRAATWNPVEALRYE
ncbi:ABC transporter permease [Sunxiuqinia indica]|uniref:ABC transporter permease n=1 Tax=Sunxiuqinia indica TaxID=2692584 RepID=UPI00135CD1FC|nr:ABC transporter permease [Sunxiuqinia indica]